MSQADAAECKHPVQLFGMCALCGQPVDTESEESASLPVMHSHAAVKVSAEEAQRLDSETTSHLLSQRKLALITSQSNYEALKSVGRFRLGIDGEEIKDDDDDSAPKDSAVALKASRALPDAAAAGIAVGAGVASTSASKLDDASSAASSPSAKSDTDAASSASTTATSDTTIEEALQKAREEGKTEEEVAQVRATALQFAAQTEILVDDDTELDRVYSILGSIHTEWYSAYDKLQSQTPTPTTKPSVVDLISARKTKVLAGCTIVFSSMIPTGHNPETSDLWALAREFGATPAFQVEEGVTTHVVAARQGTLKVVNATRLARAAKVELVWPSWFHVSTSRWERQDEALYRLPWEHEILDAFEWAQTRVAEEKRQEEEKEKAKSPKREKATQEKALADADGGEQGEALFESELNDMDWGAAADEVDAYLDSATTASNTSSPSPSMLATDGDLRGDQRWG
ncbi:hypothetical protein NDA18_002848 [Ustilago nuda]|nr:hypothetical protein NDA18_002848 [Ustilago nuda]